MNESDLMSRKHAKPFDWRQWLNRHFAPQGWGREMKRAAIWTVAIVVFLTVVVLWDDDANAAVPAGTVTVASTQVVQTAAQTQQVQQVQQTVARRRVACSDHDRRGIRYTSNSGYRVGARCESKKWAAFSGSGIGALTTAMCGVVAALGSPVGGALCITIVAATAVTLWFFVRAVRNDGKCFGVIRDWHLGAPLISVFPCRFERGAVPREVS